jgi:hypothetical protein
MPTAETLKETLSQKIEGLAPHIVWFILSIIMLAVSVFLIGLYPLALPALFTVTDLATFFISLIWLFLWTIMAVVWGLKAIKIGLKIADE